MDTTQILLIGDSITEGFDVQRFLPGRAVRNVGVSGDSTSECLERIVASWFIPRPDRIFLCIGTNDLARDRSDAEILAAIRLIVQRIRHFAPNVPVDLTSLFPTRNNPPRPNERIRGFNTALRGLAQEIAAGYCDLHPHFTDGGGELKEEYTEDGLHLTATAYQHWAEILNDR